MLENQNKHDEISKQTSNEIVIRKKNMKREEEMEILASKSE